MDPEDESIQGVMKYLVYTRRKSLEFQKDMILIRYSSDKDYDPSKVIEGLTEQNFPKDETEEMVRAYMEKKTLLAESRKSITVEKDEHGAIKLRIS